MNLENTEIICPACKGKAADPFSMRHKETKELVAVFCKAHGSTPIKCDVKQKDLN